jgi:Carboxypeptidase regulatory-like domain
MRSVEGVVTGPDGEPVAGAVVLLKDSKTLQVRSFITLKDGSYHFYGLSRDISYDLRAEHGKESSGSKTVSSFNDHAKIKVNLKLKS